MSKAPNFFEGANQQITSELLEICRQRVAKAIVSDERRGETYFPIYDRLNAEMLKMKQRSDKLAEVRETVRLSMDRNRMLSR